MTNPWTQAATQNRTWSHRSFRLEGNPPTHYYSDANTHSSERCHVATLRYILQFLHVLDALVGVSLLLNASIATSHMSRAQQGSSTFLLTCMWVFGWILLIRAFAGWCGIRKKTTDNHRPPCCGIWRVSLSISVLFAFFLFLWSMTLLIMGGNHVRYLIEQHDKLVLPADLYRWLIAKASVLWLFLLFLAILELFRWVFIIRYIRATALPDGANDGIHNTRRKVRPWWWRSNTPPPEGEGDLVDPLLDPRRQQPRPPQSRGWFGGLFGGEASSFREPSESENLRDDTSVDFANVQEEWASKSELDPLWWTHDEEGGGGGAKPEAGGPRATTTTTSNTTKPAPEDSSTPSWLD